MKAALSCNKLQHSKRRDLEMDEEVLKELTL